MKYQYLREIKQNILLKLNTYCKPMNLSNKKCWDLSEPGLQANIPDDHRPVGSCQIPSRSANLLRLRCNPHRGVRQSGELSLEKILKSEKVHNY